MSAQSAYNAADWQQYWDTWLKTQREFAAHIPDINALNTQWNGLFTAWRENLSGDVPRADAYQQFFAQAGQQFMQLLHQFAQGAGDGKNPADIAGDWARHMQSFLSALPQSGASPFSFSQMFGIPGWNSGAWKPNWNAAFQHPAFGGASAPWAHMNAFQNGFANNGTQGFDPFGLWAGLPGIGYTREKQEAWNHLYKHWTDFESRASAYMAAMAQVGMSAAERFQDYVSNPPEGAPPLQSLKDIYAKWVDICEEVYATYALSEDYTRVYGEVVNALMALRREVNRMTDSAAEQLNMPTRKEVDSLHKRVHELRRDNIRLKQDMAALQEKLGTSRAPVKAAKPSKAAQPKKPQKPAKPAKSAKKRK